MYQLKFKRLFDFFLSLFLLLILSPIMVLIFLLVWINIGYPIFKQTRPGLNKKLFTVYKFRTLNDDLKEISINKKQSKLGIFLRKTGLDETPQLFNVLNNSMSLVGPRPLLTEYLNKYSDYENIRHLVKPGITGLAQVYPTTTGKKDWRKSIRLDIFYVSNVTFALDLFILVKTIKIIFANKKQYNDFNKSF